MMLDRSSTKAGSTRLLAVLICCHEVVLGYRDGGFWGTRGRWRREASYVLSNRDCRHTDIATWRKKSRKCPWTMVV